MGYPNWIERISDVLVDGIRTRTNNPTLNAVLGVPDGAGKSIGGNLGDFQANTNLASLKEVVGDGWDTANKDMYSLLYTDLLGHPTHGLAAIQADIGDGSALTLGSIAGVLGDPATDTFAEVIGQLLDPPLATNAASDGTQTGVTLLRTILDRIGQTPDAADDAIHTILGQRDATPLGKNADDTGAESAIALLRSIIDRIGNVGTSDIYSSLQNVFFEEEDVPVSIDAIAASETTVLDLSEANTRYMVKSLRLKAADPSTETLTVRLYELINDVLTNVDSFEIDAANFGTYHSLMDMFGLPHLAGDNLKVTVQMSGGAAVAVTGQYSYSKTKTY